MQAQARICPHCKDDHQPPCSAERMARTLAEAEAENASLRAELEKTQRLLTDAYGQIDTIHMETHCADPSLETIQEQSAPDGECWDCDHPEGLSDAAREGK